MSLFFLLSFLFHSDGWGQHTDTTVQHRSVVTSGISHTEDSVKVRQKGEITYIQEERITILDEYMKANPLKHEGYRIQLVFGSRDEVSRVKSRFLAQWSYSAYESYLQPNFRLRVGDFMTRFEAEKALKELKATFPGAYVVPDRIEVPQEFK